MEMNSGASWSPRATVRSVMALPRKSFRKRSGLQAFQSILRLRLFPRPPEQPNMNDVVQAAPGMRSVEDAAKLRLLEATRTASPAAVSLGAARE